MQQYTYIGQLIVSGGLSQLDGLCQKLADLNQISIRRSTTTEATARGAAWLSNRKPVSWVQQTNQNQHFDSQANPQLFYRYQKFIDEISVL